MDKEAQREAIKQQLAQFFAQGGREKKLKGKKNPVQRKVTA